MDTVKGDRFFLFYVFEELYHTISILASGIIKKGIKGIHKRLVLWVISKISLQGCVDKFKANTVV